MRSELMEVTGLSFPSPLPRQFGKYTVLGRLATDGMAEVYVARATGIEGSRRSSSSSGFKVGKNEAMIDLKASVAPGPGPDKFGGSRAEAARAPGRR
jgi:hypothetical protein